MPYVLLTVVWLSCAPYMWWTLALLIHKTRVTKTRGTTMWTTMTKRARNRPCADDVVVSASRLVDKMCKLFTAFLFTYDNDVDDYNNAPQLTHHYRLVLLCFVEKKILATDDNGLRWMKYSCHVVSLCSKAYLSDMHANWRIDKSISCGCCWSN